MALRPNESLSISMARKLCLSSQILCDNMDPAAGKEGAAGIVKRLGYVQIDTISVVRRAHHHTIWTRIPDYQPCMLSELLSPDRRIFEYWGHSASYIPMDDYRFYMHRMKNFSDPMDKWVKDRLEKCGHLMDDVLRRIRREGPLGSRDFKSPPDSERGQWWNWKPSKTALELLFWRGDLMVTRRDNFQRIYDLTERVLPEQIDTRMPPIDELGRFLVRRALSSYGIATRREIISHIHAASGSIVSEALLELLAEGEVLPVTVGDGSGYFALASTMSGIPVSLDRSRIHILSPFDNFIIQRDRIRKLFGFRYVLECYLPKVKREYGYFVLPILWGDELVGRLDPKADRRSGKLIIRSIHFEPGFIDYDGMLPALAAKLADFARFNGCTEIELGSVSPSKTASRLAKLLEHRGGQPRGTSWNPPGRSDPNIPPTG